MTAPLAVTRGSILAYRVFDVGEIVELEEAEKLVPTGRRVVFSGPLVEGLVIAVRPLELQMADCEIEVPGFERRPLRARVTARLYEFGAVAFMFEIPIPPGTEIASLIPICSAMYDAPSLDALGNAYRQEIIMKLGASITNTHEWNEAESYTIFFIEELDGSIEALANSENVAKLMLGEVSPKPLSDAVRQDVLRTSFSYLADDLILIDWNSAVVVEPSGSRIVPHVLELATCQLLEFRYYDGLLDRQLGRVYDEVERAPRILRSPFSARSRQVVRRFMDLTEFTESVDNAIKSVGDFYLARVYMAAIRRFRVPEWRESVEAKLGLVERAYELLKGEVEVSRTQLLELTIVVLILFEIIAAFQR